MGSMSLIHWLLVAIVLAVLLVPVARITDRPWPPLIGCGRGREPHQQQRGGDR
jgi:hypothetical protein